MKKALLFFGLLLLVLPIKAQDYQDYKNKQKEEMERYKDSMKRDYDEYRHQANEDYARFMRERWEEFQAMKGDPVPDIPEPPQPFERKDDAPIPVLPLKKGKVVLQNSPDTLRPLKRPEKPVLPNTLTIPEFHFVSYGTPMMVHLSNSLKIQLKDIAEKTVADAWDKLAVEEAEVLLEDCLALREKFALGDWAYYCMLRDFSEKCYGRNANEAVLMESFLLAQSGYSVRIGRQDNQLILLLPFDGSVYVMSFVEIKGTRFYIINRDKNGGINVFNRSFTDNDRVLSLRMKETPKYAVKATAERSFTSKRYPELSVTLSTNQNLMDFYDGYPKCVWTNYSWTGLSAEVKEKLYPVLRSGIESKSQIEAANRIINFVQTAFEYKTDRQQFGRERSFFADELFYFPFSDCEDRSILFSILIKDLLGLDVVLLHYPDHLATAVCYTESLNGTYFTMDGKTWYISDPTYIGARVGECMPGYANSNPEVYRL